MVKKSKVVKSKVITIKLSGKLKAALGKAADEAEENISEYVRKAIEARIKEEEKMKSLLKITGQESGIVIEGNTVIVANWGNYNEGQMPIVGLTGMDLLPYPVQDMTVTREYEVKDIKDELPSIDNMDVAYDANGDIQRLWADSDVTGGTVYIIGDKTVIAPKDWA